MTVQVCLISHHSSWKAWIAVTGDQVGACLFHTENKWGIQLVHAVLLLGVIGKVTVRLRIFRKTSLCKYFSCQYYVVNTAEERWGGLR